MIRSAVKLPHPMTESKNATDAPVRINNEDSRLRASAGTASERPSDENLVNQVAQGSSDALEALYDRYASTVLGICLKVIGDRTLAEDVLQETFWRVWKSAGTYQSERGTFTSWLFRIARNLAIDSYRRRNVRPQASYAEEGTDPILEEMPDPDMDVAERAQSMLRNRQVRKAVASLPQLQRQVIEMAYFYGMHPHSRSSCITEAARRVGSRRV
jgi:RNA polymerase sigma-70 factor (ECF subfamily)